MKLQPRWEPSNILIAIGERIEEEGTGKLIQVETGRKEMQAEVWRGLAMYQYHDEIGTKNRVWRIAHVESGRVVLRHLRSREECVLYVRMLNEWRSAEQMKVDWRMTEKQLRGLRYYEEIMGVLKGLQREIDR